MKLSDIINGIIKNDLNFDVSELNSFYQYYISTFHLTSEAPDKFIFTAQLAALGSAISLSRSIKWGLKDIYPNFWTIIVGESTRSRKSTSLNIGLNVVKEMNRTFPDRDFLLPSRSSMASLMEVLQEENNGVIHHSELATLLSLLKKGFNTDMKSLLTDFFDVPSKYKANFITKDDLVLEYPIFSLATATTPIWLKTNLQKDDATSGFLARFLFSYQKGKTQSIAIPAQPDRVRLQKIEEVFKKIYTLNPCEIELDESFRRVYTDFYEESDSLILELSVDNALKSIFSRLQTDYFLKFTILECVLSDTLVATDQEAFRAKYLVAFFMVQAIAVIKQIAPSETMAIEMDIQKLLSEVNEATRTDLYRYFKNNLSARQLNAAIGALKNAGVIVSKKSKDKNNAEVFRLDS